MTQQEFIQQLTGTSNLDLTVTIKDTNETLMTADFEGLTFDQNSYVSMKLKITVQNKDVTVNQHGQIIPSDPIVYTKIIRANEHTQIPVIDSNGNLIRDSNNTPLTIPENVYWKYLAWDNVLPHPFKVLLENTIKIKFNLLPDTTVLQINRADFPSLINP